MGPIAWLLSMKGSWSVRAHAILQLVHESMLEEVKNNNWEKPLYIQQEQARVE